MCLGNNVSLRTKFFTYVFGTVVLVFVVLMASSLAFVSQFRKIMVEEGEDALLNQIQVNSQKTIKNGGDFFNNYLLVSTGNFLMPYVNGLKEVIRLENAPGKRYSIGSMPFYWDHNVSNLAHPLSYDARYPDRLVSLKAPTTFIPGQRADGTNLDALYHANEEYVNQTTRIFPYFPAPFFHNQDFVAGYFGQDDAGVFTQFPGVSSLQTDPDRSYDPRARPWYESAVELADDGYYITEPYEDFSGKGWMITLAKTLTVDGQFIGVGGVDMLIIEIQENIRSIKFKESGFAHLLQSDGTVVASPQWNPEPGDPLITYSDLSSPEISESQFEELLTSGSYTFGTYQLNSYRINDNYLIVSVVPLNEVQEPINQIRTAIEDDADKLLVAVIVTIVVGAIFSILLILWLTNGITSKFQAISDALILVSDNVGEDKIFSNVRADFGAGTGIAELDQLRARATELINRGKAREQGDGLQENPFSAKFAPQYPHVPAYAPPGGVAVSIVPPYNNGMGATAVTQVYPTGVPAPSAPSMPHGGTAMEI